MLFQLLRSWGEGALHVASMMLACVLCGPSPACDDGRGRSDPVACIRSFDTTVATKNKVRFDDDGNVVGAGKAAATAKASDSSASSGEDESGSADSGSSDESSSESDVELRSAQNASADWLGLSDSEGEDDANWFATREVCLQREAVSSVL